MPQQVQWKILDKKCDSYNDDRVCHMRLLYQGGYAIKEQSGKFLEPMMGESPAAFEERKHVSAYIPLLPKFVDTYTATLFSEELSVTLAQDADDVSTLGTTPDDPEFYKVFAANADGLGCSFHSFMKEVYRTAQVEEYGWFGQDLPKQTSQPVNLLEEELSGQDRNILYKIDQLEVWDYHCGQDGRLDWIKFGKCVQDLPSFDAEPMHHYEIKVWKRTLDGNNIQVSWELYVTQQYKADQDPKPEDFITLTDEGGSSFRQIPVYCLDFSNNMSIGFKVGPLAQEHFQMRSYENSATARACLTIPVVKLGPSIPAPGGAINPTQSKKHRGDDPRGQFNSKGYLVVGKEDAVEIVETEGTALKFMHVQNEDRVETMHEVVSQLHSSSKQTASKTGRSAAAMKESRYAMETALSEHATLIYDLAKQVYQDLATSRQDSIVVVPNGLCTETPEDTDVLLKRYQVMTRSAIGSKLFEKKYRYQLANSLMNNTSREEQAEIMDQINETVDKGVAKDMYGPTFDPELQQQINAKAAPENAEEPGANDPQGDPQSGAASKSGSSKPASGKPAASKAPKMGKSGQPQLPPGSHLQTGQHVEWQVVYDILLKDYKPEDLTWVKTVSWTGPVEVDAGDISFAGEEDWKANQPGPQGADKVDQFAEILSDKGWSAFKPVILANMPHNNEQYTVIDGRHRVKAAQQTGIPILAYIAQVGSVDSDTPHMQLHSKQQTSGASSS